MHIFRQLPTPELWHEFITTKSIYTVFPCEHLRPFDLFRVNVIVFRLYAIIYYALYYCIADEPCDVYRYFIICDYRAVRTRVFPTRNYRAGRATVEDPRMEHNFSSHTRQYCQGELVKKKKKKISHNITSISLNAHNHTHEILQAHTFHNYNNVIASTYHTKFVFIGPREVCSP